MGAARFVATYLDTHVASWLAFGETRKLSPAANAQVERGHLLLSPMALLELELLYEIGRSRVRASDIEAKLRAELNVQVCDLPFASVSYQAMQEGWTRDPFDRIIVAQAHANARAPLVSADVHIRRHYPNTIW